MSTPQPWRILKSETAFQHRWYHLRRDTVELPNGEVIDDYFVSVRPSGAFVFPVTPEGNVIFVRQYKHAIGEIVLELPGGMLDIHTEDPAEAATRELVEETGYEAPALRLVGQLYENPTKDTSQVFLYVAENVHPTGATEWDATEQIELVYVPLAEVLPKLMNGEIRTTNTVSHCFLALRALGY